MDRKSNFSIFNYGKCVTKPAIHEILRGIHSVKSVSKFSDTKIYRLWAIAMHFGLQILLYRIQFLKVR